jgi:hypothetical protein
MIFKTALCCQHLQAYKQLCTCKSSVKNKVEFRFRREWTQARRKRTISGENDPKPDRYAAYRG